MNDDTTATGNALQYRTTVPTNLSASGVSNSLEDAADEATAVVVENVGLVIVGGLAVGLLAAALMPRSKKKKVAKRSRKISSLVSEISQALSAQAGDAASEGRDKLHDLTKSISEHSQEAKKQAGKLAGDAADQLNDSGKLVARKLVRMIEKARG